MSEIVLDDSRLTLDQGLKEDVLQPLAEKLGLDMKDLAFLCIAAAVQAGLEPLAPKKKDPNNWHASSTEDVYVLLKLALATQTPVAMAAQLVNRVLSEMQELNASINDVGELFHFFDSLTT